MLLRSLYFGIIFLIFYAGNCYAQQRDDSVIVETKIDTSGENVLALDTAVKKKFDPKVATLRSAILPGWGQAYNKKYWKIPIIYGALGTSVGVFLYNIKTYKLLKMAVIYRAAKDSAKVDPDLQSLSTEALRGYRNIYRQNIDYSVLAFLALWGLNVVDATVDAHLKAFDVSPDITMKIRPAFNSTINNGGISVVFYLNDKKNRPSMPLP